MSTELRVLKIDCPDWLPSRGGCKAGFGFCANEAAVELYGKKPPLKTCHEICQKRRGGNPANDVCPIPPPATRRRFLADRETQQKRLAICGECPERKLLPVIGAAYCGKCGCTLALASWVAGKECPLDKW